MTIEEAIKNIVTYGYYADDIPTQVAKAFDMAVAALRAQQAQQNKMIWHSGEETPTDEKDYCVIRKYHSQGLKDVETVKDGEIWVEMDYWNNSPGNWYGWEDIGPDNPYWETLYWIDLGRTEIQLPDDLPGKVTRMFGEVVSQDTSPCEKGDPNE